MAANREGPDHSVKAITRVLDRMSLPAGTTIFTEGQLGTDAYILLQGDVSIFAQYGTPHQRELIKVQPGNMFGELALMADARRTASAYTENGCELLVVGQEKLEKKLKGADPFVRYWIKYLSRRVIELSTPKNDSAGVDTLRPAVETD